MGLRNETLGNMILTNHVMMLHYHYSLTELENMVPWERSVYVELVSKWIKEKRERLNKK
jgi:hypothetical protein